MRGLRRLPRRIQVGGVADAVADVIEDEHGQDDESVLRISLAHFDDLLPASS
jgi:hypothetical protein